MTLLVSGMQIDRRGFNGGMAQILLDMAQVIAGVGLMRRGRVPPISPEI
jgi:hypothetical protein